MIHRDGRQFGPYSPEDLRRYLAEGSVLTTDLAWAQGMPNWVPVSQVLGIPAPVTAPPPPPPPPMMSAMPGVPQQAPAYLAPPPAKRSRGGLVVAGVCIVAVAAAGYFWRAGVFTRTVETQLSPEKTELMEFLDMAQGRTVKAGSRLFLSPWPSSRIIGEPTPNPSDNRVQITWLTYTGGNSYELRGSPERGNSPNSDLLGRFTVGVPAGYQHPLELTRYWEVQTPVSSGTQLQFVGYMDGAGPSGGLLSKLLPSKAGESKFADGVTFIREGLSGIVGSKQEETLAMAGKPSLILRVTNPKDANQSAGFEFYDGLQVLRIKNGSQDRVWEAAVTTARWKVWKDLGVGASAATILQTLGAPEAQGAEFLYYPIPNSSGRLVYRLKNGICTGLLWFRHNF